MTSLQRSFKEKQQYLFHKTGLFTCLTEIIFFEMLLKRSSLVKGPTGFKPLKFLFTFSGQPFPPSAIRISQSAFQCNFALSNTVIIRLPVKTEIFLTIFPVAGLLACQPPGQGSYSNRVTAFQLRLSFEPAMNCDGVTAQV